MIEVQHASRPPLGLDLKSAGAREAEYKTEDGRLLFVGWFVCFVLTSISAPFLPIPLAFISLQ